MPLLLRSHDNCDILTEIDVKGKAVPCKDMSCAAFFIFAVEKQLYLLPLGICDL